jgi:hypothetical protein
MKEYPMSGDLRSAMYLQREVNDIHEAVMNPMEVKVLPTDTFTLKAVKELIIRAVQKPVSEIEPRVDKSSTAPSLEEFRRSLDEEHAWIPDGGSLRFESHQGGEAPHLHTTCKKCGERTWFTERQWALLSKGCGT